MFVKQTLNGALGTSELPPLGRSIFRKYFFFRFSAAFLMALSSTFYILYAIDAIGFSAAAIMTSGMLLVSLIFDYPSGSLGDWLGQRWVLAAAYISYGIGFYLLVTASSFESFLIVAFINGFGNAQASGAIDSWMDNNYKLAVSDEDPERKTYGVGRHRVNSLSMFANGSSFLVGGTLATLVSRQFVFQIQVGFTAIFLVLILFLVKDIQGEKNSKPIESQGQNKLRQYTAYLKGGISFLLSSKTAFFFIVGNAIFYTAWIIWGNLILFPIYFGYSGSDGLTSLLRTTIFMIGIFIGLYVAGISKRFSNDKLPHFMFGFWIVFFSGWITILLVNPVNNEFNLLGSLFTILLMNGSIGFLMNIGDTIRQRILLDLIPSEYRNSIYSLIPSLISIFGIPLLPIAGRLIEVGGLVLGVAMVGVVALIGTVSIVTALMFHKPADAIIQVPTPEASPTTG